MENQPIQPSPYNTYQSPQLPSEPKRKARLNGKVILIIISALIAISVIGVFAYLWNNEKNKTSELNNELSTLKNSTKDTEASKPQTAEENVPETKTAEPTTPTETVFKAEVGKFTLTLPSDYVIVKEIDGGGEGGPSTRIKIAKTTSTSNVFDTGYLSGTSITARPANNDTFENWKTSSLSGNSATIQDTINIDGTNAEVYIIAGIGSIKHIIFTKNNIYYDIEMFDPESENNTELQKLIINGFKFN